MKTLFLLLLAVTFISCAGRQSRHPAATGLLEMEGEIDGKKFWILKPDARDRAPMPVVYFLHGRGGNPLMFRDHGGVKALKAHLESGGKPFAVVAFTGTFNGKDSYWINETRDHILTKMIPRIERKFKVGGALNRMIAGISMGSHGAMQMALTTKLFKCVAGHSLVLRSYESMNGQFPGLFGSPSQFATRDPLSLIQKIQTKDQVPFKKVWVDIGGKDVTEFLDRARLMEEELLRLGFDSKDLDIGQDFPDGAHDYRYWKSRMPDYIHFYSSCFSSP